MVINENTLTFINVKERGKGYYYRRFFCCETNQKRIKTLEGEVKEGKEILKKTIDENAKIKSELDNNQTTSEKLKNEVLLKNEKILFLEEEKRNYQQLIALLEDKTSKKLEETIGKSNF